MKLELKHLAPYLPYGLEFYVEHANGTRLDNWVMTIDTSLRIVIQHQNKPILRPLSDLTKENHGVNLRDLLIERGFYKSSFADGHNCYSYRIVIKPFGKIFKISNHGDWVLMLSFNEPDRSKYFIFNYLLENHFDVFGLIEKGLATDINTLQD
jgi:hypothetical protein